MTAGRIDISLLFYRTFLPYLPYPIIVPYLPYFITVPEQEWRDDLDNCQRSYGRSNRQSAQRKVLLDLNWHGAEILIIQFWFGDIEPIRNQSGFHANAEWLGYVSRMGYDR